MAINKKSNNKTFFLNILIVSAVLAIILWFTTKLFINGLYPLATIMGAVALLIAMVYLRKKFLPDEMA